MVILTHFTRFVVSQNITLHHLWNHSITLHYYATKYNTIQFNSIHHIKWYCNTIYHIIINYVNIYIRELKKLDDKQMLTETHLTESRIYHSLQNIPKGEYVRSLRFLWNSAYKSENITAMNGLCQLASQFETKFLIAWTLPTSCSQLLSISLRPSLSLLPSNIFCLFLSVCLSLSFSFFRYFFSLFLLLSLPICQPKPLWPLLALLPMQSMSCHSSRWRMTI